MRLGSDTAGRRTGKLTAPADWRHRLVARYYRTADHPAKLRLLRWLKSALQVDQVQVSLAPGVVMELDDSDYVQREILFHGGYELASVALFRRLLRDARGCTDIGAHHGQYSLIAARALAPRGGRVLSFEPTPANCAALLRNLHLSGLTNVDVCTAALSDLAGLVRMQTPSATNTGGARICAAPAGEGPSLLVPALPLGALTTQLKPELLDLVKLDVEGYEGRVLRALFATTDLRPRQILLEFAPQLFPGDADAALPAWLAQEGYEVKTVEGRPFVSADALPEGNLWASYTG